MRFFCTEKVCASKSGQSGNEGKSNRRRLVRKREALVVGAVLVDIEALRGALRVLVDGPDRG